MITDWFLEFLAWIAETILTWIPEISPPAWLLTFGGWVSTAFSAANSMGAWLPISLLFTIVATILACLVISLTTKVVRIAISHVSGGGGSAA